MNKKKLLAVGAAVLVAGALAAVWANRRRTSAQA